MKAGLLIAREGQSIEHENAYDSRRRKLTVDPDAVEPHFDLIPELSGGTRWDIPAGSLVLYEEVIFRIRHGLPFKPQVMAFFTMITEGGSPSTYLGRSLYSVNMALMTFNAVGLGNEWLEADADEQYFYIKHKAYRGASTFDSWITNGNTQVFKVRYFIFGKPSYMLTGGVSKSAQ